MYSFVSICGSPENGQIRCELELVSAMESENIKPEDKETTMLDLSKRLFTDYFDALGKDLDIEEGDIFVAEHEGEYIIRIIYKDNFEKARRIKLLEELLWCVPLWTNKKWSGSLWLLPHFCFMSLNLAYFVVL